MFWTFGYNNRRKRQIHNLTKKGSGKKIWLIPDYLLNFKLNFDWSSDQVFFPLLSIVTDITPKYNCRKLSFKQNKGNTWVFDCCFHIWTTSLTFYLHLAAQICASKPISNINSFSIHLYLPLQNDNFLLIVIFPFKPAHHMMLKVSKHVCIYFCRSSYHHLFIPHINILQRWQYYFKLNENKCCCSDKACEKHVSSTAVRHCLCPGRKIGWGCSPANNV